MDSAKLGEIRALVDQAISAGTKSSAAPAIERLEFISNTQDSLNGYAKGKLREVVAYTKDASGQVKNKELHISNMERSWYVLEQEVRKTDHE